MAPNSEEQHLNADIDPTLVYSERGKIEDLKPIASRLISSFFKRSAYEAQKQIDFRINPLLAELREDLFILVEYPYVDKVYRSSYYGYYSSKRYPYERNCIRISFLSKEPSDTLLRTKEGAKELQKHYLGFLILRPTAPSFFGRSVINPKAFRGNKLHICTVSIPSSVDGIKVQAIGFPASGQNSETMSCAETSLWSLMEYFGYRYAEYKPMLPMKLLERLGQVSIERQLPSRGLTVEQISFILRDSGFGTRIYHKSEYKKDFHSILAAYVDSGIPVLLILDNVNRRTFKDEDGKNLLHQRQVHANLCIGNLDFSHEQVDNLKKKTQFDRDVRSSLRENEITLYDYHQIERKYVFIDDNRPPYQKAILEEPAAHYKQEDFRKCELVAMAVPLYPKIYLEAFEARNFAISFLAMEQAGLLANKHIVLRTFLTSSRAFKNAAAIKDSLVEEARDSLMAQALPKFIWITELSTKDQAKNGTAHGIMLLDATEPTTDFYHPFIIAIHSGKLISMDSKTSAVQTIPLPLNEFSTFATNLK